MKEKVPNNEPLTIGSLKEKYRNLFGMEPLEFLQLTSPSKNFYKLAITIT
jgi:hypothetical protein